jgi:hypothetical protein
MPRSVRRLASATWLLNNLKHSPKFRLAPLTVTSALIPFGIRSAATRASKKSSPPLRQKNLVGNDEPRARGSFTTIELALVFVRLDHVARFIVNVNHGIM